MRWANVELILIVRKWIVTVLIAGMTLILLTGSFRFLVLDSPPKNYGSLTIHYECSPTQR